MHWIRLMIDFGPCAIRWVCCGQIRAAVKSQKAGKYGMKVKARSKRKAHVAKHPLPRDKLADVFK